MCLGGDLLHLNTQIVIRPSERDFARWIQEFVPPITLWWWDDSPIPNEDLAVRIVARADSRTDELTGDIVYVNAYHAWAMPNAVTRIVVDSGDWGKSLSPTNRRLASELQVRFKRGMCIALERFPNADPPISSVADDHLVLDHHIWSSLPEVIRRRVIETELPLWDDDISFPISHGTPRHIASIAHSFIRQEGVNCLAVTAFAIAGNHADLLQWMLPNAFSGELRNYGYAEVSGSPNQPGDVIVFRDEDGNIVHAAYVLAPDRILNKNGQSSFNPVAIAELASLEADWKGYSYVVFRQASANSAML